MAVVTKRMLPNAWRWGVVLGLMAPLIACTPEPEPEAPRDAATLVRLVTMSPSDIDPHTVSGAWQQSIVHDLYEGLYVYDRTGTPRLAMAQSTTVSADQLTWTFELRDAQWSDGTRVTANDFVFSIQRVLRREPAFTSAPLLHIIAGARDYAAGDDEALQVQAPSSRRLVISLDSPAPFLPELLAHPIMAPVPSHIFSVTDDFVLEPSDVIVNGAYEPAAFHDERVVLRRNALYHDVNSVCFDQVEYRKVTDAGEIANQIRAGEADVAFGADPARLGDLADRAHYSSGRTAVYLVANVEFAPFNDPAVREAVALAINTVALARDEYEALAEPTERLSPAGFGDDLFVVVTRYAQDVMVGRRRQALNLLNEAGFNDGETLKFVLSYPRSGPYGRVAQAIKDDIETTAPFTQVELTSVDDPSHIADLETSGFQIAIMEWHPAYADVSSLLPSFLPWTGPLNYSNWFEHSFTELYLEGMAEDDPLERARLLADAEQQVLDAHVAIPLVSAPSIVLVGADIEGWTDTVVGASPSHRFCRVGLDPPANPLLRE